MLYKLTRLCNHVILTIIVRCKTTIAGTPAHYGGTVIISLKSGQVKTLT